MEKTRVAHFYAHMDTDTYLDTHIGLAWMLTRDLQGTEIVEHGGLTDGFIAFVCFDLTRHRGVVILSNSQDFDVGAIGTLLLEGEWQSDRRPRETEISSAFYDSFVGQYRQSNVADAPPRPGIGIRREGNRLFVQATRSKSWPADVLLPPAAVELRPESEDRFFERLSGMPMTFLRDAEGKVTGLTVHYRSNGMFYDKISAEPPQASAPPQPHVAIKLDAKLLDAVVGRYEFAPNTAFPTGAKLTIWREGDQLLGEFRGENTLQGAFDIYPESETTFFIELNGVQLTFIKNDKGEAMAVIHHSYRAGVPDCEGEKLK